MKRYKKIGYGLVLGIALYNLLTDMNNYPILTMLIVSSMYAIKWCLEELTEDKK
mgnify:CR=1 FL=1